MTKLTKTDYNLAKGWSYSCRYLDDICIVNFKDFGTISKNIYDNTLILEDSICSYKRDFLDIYIRVTDDKFVTGIYHKVDEFNFEVIIYPFPDSNIHSSLGYSTFYSQLIRFHRLCNNKSDFLFRAKLIYQNLINRGYQCILLRKSFMRFINIYPVEIKYGVQRHDNCSFKCSILTITLYVISTVKIVTPCFVRIENIARLPFTNRTNRTSLFPKNLQHTHKVRWRYPLPNRLAERKWG